MSLRFRKQLDEPLHQLNAVRNKESGTAPRAKVENNWINAMNDGRYVAKGAALPVAAHS